jgi:hypothetical protein
VPLEQRDNGTQVRVVAGTTSAGTIGAIRNDWVRPTYLDVTLPAGLDFEQAVDAGDTALLYVVEGALAVGEEQAPLTRRTLGILGAGDCVQVSTAAGARFLLISAQPLNEPVARGGPFVMNTREEIIQAFDDYRHNRF